jgi:hypothetical protein
MFQEMQRDYDGRQTDILPQCQSLVWV